MFSLVVCAGKATEMLLLDRNVTAAKLRDVFLA